MIKVIGANGQTRGRFFCLVSSDKRTVLEVLKDWFEVDVSRETVELAVMGVLNFGSNGFRHTDLTGRKE